MLAQGDVERLSSSSAVADFFSQSLGYKVDPVIYDAADLGIPEASARLICHHQIELLSDYQRQFQVYRMEVDSMRRTDFRAILEPFYRKHPAGNYLFVFTKDYSEHAFVSPVRVLADGPAKTKLRLRTLRVDRGNVYHTDLETLDGISISPLEQHPDLLWKKHNEAFDVERVTDAFYGAYTAELEEMKMELTRQRKGTEKQIHGFAQLVLNRLMFLYFLQRKGWFKWEGGAPDKRYLRTLWHKYGAAPKGKVTGSRATHGFYSRWLQLLFFDAFNRKHGYLNADLPKEVVASFKQMPYLNGGLFSEDELDACGFAVSDESFVRLFGKVAEPGLLERHNFTVDESQPLDHEVAVDPEMLGFVYESLVQQQERHQGGIFYTPRTEIDLMCRLSLVEYLHGDTNTSKEDLIPFIFASANPSGDGEVCDDPLGVFSDNRCRKLLKALQTIRIVDPAVGSGSFLVGMMNVLVELRKALAKRLGLKTEQNEFALKRQIISENLYGVDVQDWAVRVCELRMWLALVIEGDERQMDIYGQPLLPKLSFRVRQGDSLVEEVAGVSLSLRGEYAYVPPPLQQRLTRLAEEKAAFFAGSSHKSKEALERDELKVLIDVINSTITRLNREIESLTRKKPEVVRSEAMAEFDAAVGGSSKSSGSVDERRREQARDLEARRNTLNEVRTDLTKGRVPAFFLWDVAFAEVFQEKGGFDIVIGNPPYVREQEIAPPLESTVDYDADEWRELRQEYKGQLERSVKTHWGERVKIAGKSDLYVYFYYHGVALLRPSGVFCFVNSNSWLDVGYGASLQEFLLKNVEVVAVVDNHAKRTFKHADVNTVVVLLRRPEHPITIHHPHLIRFYAFKKPFEECITVPNLLAIEGATEVKRNKDYRIYPISASDLWMDGVELDEEDQTTMQGLGSEHAKYVGGKWGGKFLRAPDVFFEIILNANMIPLAKVGAARLGVTTGANEFFFLKKMGRGRYLASIGGSQGEVSLPDEFLHPVLRTVSECKCPTFRRKDSQYCILVVRRDCKDRDVKAYVKLGERAGIHNRPFFKGRKCWYEIGNPISDKIAVSELIYARYFFVWNPDQCVLNKNFYGFTTTISPELLYALLSCTLSYTHKVCK